MHSTTVDNHIWTFWVLGIIHQDRFVNMCEVQPYLLIVARAKTASITIYVLLYWYGHNIYARVLLLYTVWSIFIPACPGRTTTNISEIATRAHVRREGISAHVQMTIIMQSFNSPVFPLRIAHDESNCTNLSQLKAASGRLDRVVEYSCTCQSKFMVNRTEIVSALNLKRICLTCDQMRKSKCNGKS